MPIRTSCDELLDTLAVMEQGLRAPLEGISEQQLNHSFADHKMTIGQIAVHTMSWPRYFLSASPPWKKTKWTCRPCDYPLTIAFVGDVINDGLAAMRETLRSLDDEQLETTKENKKGPGYIMYRLLLHIMAHANQMSYLRSLLDPDWSFGGHFGNMASAVIKMKYHTERDTWVPGF